MNKFLRLRRHAVLKGFFIDEGLLTRQPGSALSDMLGMICLAPLGTAAYFRASSVVFMDELSVGDCEFAS